MKRVVHIAWALLVLAPLVALYPVGRLVMDWVRLSRMMDEPLQRALPRGFDWVQWQDRDGAIVAAYVFPRGTADVDGIRPGDELYHLDFQQYFSAEDLKRAIEGIAPGSTRPYTVLRDGQFVTMDVRLTRYPTFIYPLSPVLWKASMWGFTVGAFLHVLALFIVGPLAYRSRQARFSLLLILASAVWMFGNLARVLMIDFFGPPGVSGDTYPALFRTLTLLSLGGWILFPALLLHKVVADALPRPARPLALRAPLYLPALLLGGAALLAVLQGSIGPVTLDALIAPILFYVCCFVAVAAGLGLFLPHADAGPTRSGWSRMGSAVVLAVAALAALSVLDVVPILGAVADITAGWLIVGVQLLSIAPVALVSVATLRYGKVDLVLSRALMYATVLGLIFFLFVGGLYLLDPYLSYPGAPRNVLTGLYVVLLLVLSERLARPVRVYAASFFATDRQRTRERLSRFREKMRTILDPESLAGETVRTVGEALGARSVVLFLRAEAGRTDGWLQASHHPEPPFLTERVLRIVWPHFEQEGRIWARNPELNESSVPERVARILRQHGAALVVPVAGDTMPIGLLVLSGKRRRRAVYNLEDVDLLRALCGQLALAVERLRLIEREKALAREHAEAQLVALRAQINPHFLFNALNTITALIEEKPAEAERTVEHLAAIFRHVLQAGSRPFVPLEDECRLVDHYLAIERVRFDGKLRIEEQWSPALRQIPVPAFALQTLVENAVKHGIEKRRGGGTIRLSSRLASEHEAELVVEDTGAGIPSLFESDAGRPPDRSFFGLGLRNVSARLEQLYGRTDLLSLVSRPDAGTVVRLRLPLAAGEAKESGSRFKVQGSKLEAKEP